VRAVGIHDVLLVASSSVARALEDQAPPVVAEVRFRVLAAVGELTDIPEVGFAWLGSNRNRNARLLASHRAHASGDETKNYSKFQCWLNGHKIVARSIAKWR
jgi:hypothetical protein